MKIEIKTIIEIPDNCLIEGQEFAAAVQIIFDELTNYAVCRHLEDARKWEVESQDDVSGTNRMISQHHVTWGKLLDALNWDYKEVKE
ncbi:MAG: hypothetical protein KAS32_31290 [Candidatus Peribacteraceae bacterium]|nr:hypothetical protein [Candidatus Peribacteraceae bacterium]